MRDIHVKEDTIKAKHFITHRQGVWTFIYWLLQYKVQVRTKMLAELFSYVLEL